MRKGLIIIVIMLFTYGALANGPILQTLPDIVIGDREDWVGTIDTNIFVFPNAFNFDNYVDDPDTPDAALTWAFKEDDLTTQNLEINTITTLIAEPLTPGDIPPGKDLRLVDAQASFVDLLAPGTLVDETVVFYVTDGTAMDSDEIWVVSIDNDFDRAVMPSVYAPQVQCLPDIVIGDREDWVGTIDTDIFVFPDAFNFDDYVDDPDTAASALMWAFKEGDITAPLNLEINNITSLPGEAHSPADIPSFKDLRAVSAFASFFDQLAPGTLVNESVIFYVTDGTYVDSDEIWVLSSDNDYDQAIPPCVQPPLVQCLPDIVIGDREDWVGTIDTDIFEFPGAFAFDDYVEDPDTTASALSWAFKEANVTPPLNLEINGITSLPAPAQFPWDIPPAKDLRAVSPYASFFDRLAPATLIDEPVIFYVTDGTYVDSDEIQVVSVDNDYDRLIPPCCPIEVATWTFDPPPDGWSFRTFIPAAPGLPNWAHASSATDAQSIGISTPAGETTDYFASWDNYINFSTPAIPWTDNSLFRAIFTMSTDQSDPANVPSVRLRFSLTRQKVASYIRLYPGDWLPLAQRPMGTTDYALYMHSPIADDGFFLAFDYIDWRDDFRAPTQGTTFLEEVVVERFDLSGCVAQDWTEVKSYAGFGLHNWTYGSASLPYLTDVYYYSVTSDGLRMDTTTAQTLAFGSWVSPGNEIDLTPNQFYRAIWTLASQDSTLVATNRIRMHTIDHRYASYMVLNRDANPAGSPLPTVGGNDYYIYAELPVVPPVDKLFLAWDLYDFDPVAGGWAKLKEVVVSRRDLLP